MKSSTVFVLALILALNGGCQQAGRSASNTQQQFFAAVKPAGMATDQALRSAHYFKVAGRRDLALRELKAALALDPKNTRLLNALGACYDEYGDYATAQQIFNQVLILDPENVAALNNLGHSYYLSGNLEQAEASLQAALAKDPNHKWARNNLGLVWCKLGKNDEALRLWEKIDGEAQARDKLGRVMASLGKPVPPGLTPAPAPTAIVLAPSALPARMAASAAKRPAQLPELAQARPPAPEPAAPIAAKVEPPPARAMVTEAPAALIQPVALAETKAPDVAPEPLPAAPAALPVALTPEPPASHSRAKIIEVPSEPDKSPGQAKPLEKLAVIPQETQPAAETVVKAQPPVQPLEPAVAPPARLVVKTPPPEAYRLPAGSLEIRNGVGVKRLAKNMRRLLSHHGYQVAIADNHVDFGVPETVVYFRAYLEEAARALNDNFLKAKRLIRKDNLRSDIDIKIVLGHDLFHNNDNLAPFQASGPHERFGPQLALNP